MDAHRPSLQRCSYCVCSHWPKTRTCKKPQKLSGHHTALCMLVRPFPGTRRAAGGEPRCPVSVWMISINTCTQIPHWPPPHPYPLPSAHHWKAGSSSLCLKFSSKWEFYSGNQASDHSRKPWAVGCDQTVLPTLARNRSQLPAHPWPTASGSSRSHTPCFQAGIFKWETGSVHNAECPC